MTAGGSMITVGCAVIMPYLGDTHVGHFRGHVIHHMENQG